MQLREKLRLALAAAPVRSAVTLGRPEPRRLRPVTSILPVETRETTLGVVYVAEERWPLQFSHGNIPLGDALNIGAEALTRLAPGLNTGDLERVAFMDIETTGLAGGTGTLAFLVGIATFEQGRVCLRQYFMADIAREDAMLASIAELLEGCGGIITFNGRCFDVPLLEGRFVLNRFRSPFGRLAHIDLLLATRRLFGRRLGSCRLAAVEELVLGVRRERDVPGWAVPGLYLDFLRHGAAGPLTGVFEHNKFDVLSMVTLLARTGEVLAGSAPEDPGVCLALARWDEAQGRQASAAELYRSTLELGPDEDERGIALQGLLRIQRRLGRWDEIERMLTAAVDGLRAGVRVRFLVELAKIKEHRRRDYAAAETLTREAIAQHEILQERSRSHPVRAPSRSELERRLGRLLRRRRMSSRWSPA